MPCTKINFYIYTKLFQLFLPCDIFHIVWEHCTCYLLIRSSRTTYFKVQHHIEVILRETASKTRYRPIPLWCWRSERLSFAGFRKETVYKQWLLISLSIERPSGTFCANFSAILLLIHALRLQKTFRGVFRRIIRMRVSAITIEKYISSSS